MFKKSGWGKFIPQIIKNGLLFWEKCINIIVGYLFLYFEINLDKWWYKNAN